MHHLLQFLNEVITSMETRAKHELEFHQI